MIADVQFKRNPWRNANGSECIDVESRLHRVRSMGEEDLFAARDWPETQKTVRQAVTRRLRRLLNDKYLKGK